ncbi:MAG: outer membrane beta-barrel protein [Bdellovibrionota bacterium]
MKILLVLFALFITSTSYAQFTSIRPTGIVGSAGFGFVNFDTSEPLTQSFEIDDGVFTAVGGEKGLGAANLYLTISLNYLKAKGDTIYNYTTTSGATNYTSNGVVPFNLDIFQAGLGLKLKLIDDYWIRPYIEAGGLFGYFQVKYTNLSVGTNVNVTGTDTGMKKDDSLFDFGYYGEAGAELAFSDTFGVRVAMRMTKSKTKEFETLADQEVEYESQVYYLSLLKSF